MGQKEYQLLLNSYTNKTIMPPKKMGSITHNSSEQVNQNKSSKSMFSKFTSSRKLTGSVNASGSSSGKTASGASSSKASISSNSRKPMTKRGSSGVDSTSSPVEIPEGMFEGNGPGGIPTTITALTDAASCLTDGFDESVVNPHRKLNPPFYQQQQQHPQQQQLLSQQQSMRRMPTGRGEPQSQSIQHGNDSAARALANLHVSAGPGIPQNHYQPQRNMPKNNSEELRRRQQQNNMVQGMNNYSFDDAGPSPDDRGGGIFDNAYDSSMPSVSGHQPPPPDRGYNRRTTSAEINAPVSDRGYNRRTTSATMPGMMPSVLGHQPTPPGRGYNRRTTSAENSGMSSNHGRAHSMGHGPRDQPPVTQQHNRAASMGHGPEQHGGVNSTQQKISDKRRMSMASSSQFSMGQNSNASTQGFNNSEGQLLNQGNDTGRQRKPSRRSTAASAPLRSSDTSQSSSHSNERKNVVVNNNGRGDSTSQSSPNSSSKASSSMQMSTSANQNPNWFKASTGHHSESTEHIRNEANLRGSSSQDYDSYNRGDDDDDRTMATMAMALRPSAMNKAKDMKYPQGDVTIIYTDVQGSTSFWETCPSDMKTATDIHDRIMRQCYTDHQGYEITTEGDAFNLAFQHPADALAFALQAQLKLYKADWPVGILNHPDGKDEPALKYRGFRVRFGIHHGPTTSRVHEATGRTVYSGEGVKIAKAVEGMCHGGQILTTMETWKAVSGMAERYLGRPQILDCGEHLLFETKNQAPGSNSVTTTRYTRRIMQLVPSDLAFDFFEARGRRDVPSADGKMGFEIKDASNVSGRLFPPLISKRQLTTCFLNAPYANGRVTICFVYTVGLDDNPDNRAHNLGILAKHLRKQLLVLSPPGYECQEDNGCWMLAFDRMAHAVTFGLQLKSVIQNVQNFAGIVDSENMVKVGILSGPFTSMGPHKTTGMADYFGPIVNRAARVASNCEQGQVCVGIPLSNGVTADPPDFGPTVNVRLQGIKKLKGITIDMAIFSCTKRIIETPYK